MKRSKWPTAVLASALLSSSIAHADFYAGVEAYQKQQFDVAFQEFETLAKLGHVNSQFMLGVMYYRGEGTSSNPLLSYGWLKLAAEGGHEKAKQLLPKLRASMVEEGIEAAERLVSAFEPHALHERLMPKILPNCNYQSMTAPKAKKLPPPDYPMHLRRAGTSGGVVVELTVAPDGTVRDTRIVRALPPKVFDDAVLQVTPKWTFEPATRDGVPVTALHTVTINFRITDMDTRELNEYLEKLAADAGTGNGIAQYVYGLVLASHPYVRKPWSESLPWITKAAQAGVKEAQFELGQSLLMGRGCEQDDRKGVEWLTAAAQQGDANAQVSLARLAFTEGPGYAPDKGLFWLRQAAAQEHPRASKYLASILAASAADRLRDPRQALELLKVVERGDRNEPTTLEIRAAALAHLGEYDDAVRAQELAVKRARQLGWNIEPMQQRLDEYLAGKAWTGELLL